MEFYGNDHPARTWGINYGVLHDGIAHQLHRQGIKLSLTICEVYESDRKAITRLRMRDIITDGESNKALKRLHKRVTQSVNKVLNETKEQGK